MALIEETQSFPSDNLMQQIAAELRYSETAFVQQLGAAEFKVRYFTPCGEVDLCGHATIATFGMMYRMGFLAQGEQCLIHTIAGDLNVIASKRVMMMMAKPQVIPATVDVERLHSIMGATSVNTSFPVEIVSTGLPDIIMPLDNVEQLYSLAPNMDALAQLSKELGVTGVHAFAFGEDGYTAHVRNFGPLYGVPEESATGTANAALTHYLHQHGIIASGDSNRFLQGETMARPSVVESTIDSNDNIWVGGECAIVATGTLLTNP